MKKILIGIVDTVTNDIVGPILPMRAVPQAIRLFSDAATGETQVRQHINDHELRLFGTLDEETLQITPLNETLITGAQWLAAQQQAETK